MNTVRRRGVALLFAALLVTVAPIASATPRQHEVPRSPRFGLTAFGPHLLDLLLGLWEKAGSSIDPFGVPKPETPPATGASPQEATRPPSSSA